uniref:non-specific serine/threonine protein kinase n=1 Tax=Cajanus cajan TaxID=3821 RepID=A0A151U6F0_CAJCA|nr:Leucine-rich repeat receptor protein kinase EXS [Cajanus cajan]
MALPVNLVLSYFLVLHTLSAIADQTSDNLSLLSFKQALQNPHVLTVWHPATPHCHWLGVTCQLGRVTSLSLPSRNLRGTLSPSLFSLSSLSLLNLRDNHLSGEIPAELGGLLQLHTLRLGSNSLAGKIPPVVGHLTSLQTLDLSGNSLAGEVPESVGNLTRLEFLDLSNNLLSGKWANVDSLLLSANRLSGVIPPELGNCSVMEHLSLSSNLLTGPIPWELCNAASLLEVDLDDNFLSGTIDNVFVKCKNLTQLVLMNNQIVGSIPEYLSELPLMVLDLDSNNFSGKIPSGLWNSSTLMEFSAANNRLEGSLPMEIGNAVMLERLVLSNNRLTGAIPKEIGSLLSLSVLNLNGNMLEGNIPTELGDCTSLTTLDLGNNQLNGSIPEKLVELSQLQCLVLSHNNLSGAVPAKKSSYFRQLSIPDLSFVQHLGVFDLSYNRLSGPIPDELGNCVVVVDLLVSNNMLSGSIPKSLSRLTNLTTLDLSGNLLSGSIPPELGGALKLQGLYLGQNQLSGAIPESFGKLSNKLCSLVNLKYLDFSQNRLEGPIPKNGICQNLSRVRLVGNKNLCGQMLGINCQASGIGRSALDNAWRLAGIAVALTLLTLSIAFVLHRWITKRQSDPEEFEERKLNSYVDHNLYFLSSSRSKEPLSINVAMFEQPLLKLTLVNILEATDNFSKANIIGDGGFGTVYKATLPNGKTVAVKKLSEAKTQGHREFMAEMETLGKVKHQNLVALLGYCSIGEEKLLVYEYMVNGSLDLWLRNKTGALEILDWNKRYKIATGAARGLAFLHHGFIPHIIHRDVKASNILLNEDFEPKVADFGLARLISACETHITTDIAGTFGYIPPEYGQSGRSTTRGDVYSFGVILLELVTGKEPTGPDFKEIEGGNLVGWVSQKIKKGQAADVLDPTVLDADSKQMMLQMLQIACVCISDNPASRPNMLQVHKFLKGIRGE